MPTTSRQSTLKRTQITSETTTRLENESMVAINGLAVPHCDGIVEEALELYWAKAKRVGERGGHWIRKSDNIIPYIVSAAVDTIVNKKPEVNFMM